MSDEFAGGADASADISSDPATLPNPVTTDPVVDPKKVEGKDDAAADPKAEKVEPKRLTAREAIKKASDRIAKEQAEEVAKKEALKADPKADDKAKPADKAAEKTAKGEGDDVEDKAAEKAKGFNNKQDNRVENKLNADRVDLPKEQMEKLPPARFSSEAKAAWETAPDPVKAEVHRAIRELEQGVEKYKPDAEAFREIKEFDDMAKKHGTSIRDAMTRYTDLERTLLTNPLQGIEAVCEYAGISLRDLAAHVVGQKPEQVQSQTDATIRQLNQQVSQLTQKLESVTSTIQKQQLSGIDAEVIEFASSDDHPRFEELADDIAFFIDTKRAKNLAEAYTLADRLNPAPEAPAKAAPAAITADLEAQTRKGSKSVSGAPSTGSDPAKRPRSTSIKESIRRAMAQVG